MLDVNQKLYQAKHVNLGIHKYHMLIMITMLILIPMEVTIFVEIQEGKRRHFGATPLTH